VVLLDTDVLEDHAAIFRVKWMVLEKGAWIIRWGRVYVGQ